MKTASCIWRCFRNQHLAKRLKATAPCLRSEKQYNPMAITYPTTTSDPRLSEHEFDYNVIDGIHAVIKTTTQRESCMWTYLRNNPPSEKTGYMFSHDDTFTAIMNNMQVGHSGASYAWTMRNLQYIASHGLDTYITEFKLKRRTDIV